MTIGRTPYVSEVAHPQSIEVSGMAGLGENLGVHGHPLPYAHDSFARNFAHFRRSDLTDGSPSEDSAVNRPLGKAMPHHPPLKPLYDGEIGASGYQ
jgi:hypothetical protein